MTETTFREAYGVLQQHAQALREQSEPNIDQLLTIVTESVAAYKTCKSRIDAVEKALEAALTNAAIDAPPATPPTRRSARAATPSAAAPPSPTGAGDDDDTPF